VVLGQENSVVDPMRSRLDDMNVCRGRVLYGI
jgi:hypothetical protein